MKELKEWLLAQNIQVVSDREQPDGSRRLRLQQNDDVPLELVLTRAMLGGSRTRAQAHIVELLREGTRPQRVRGHKL
jgi:hypothetical protein